MNLTRRAFGKALAAIALLGPLAARATSEEGNPLLCWEEPWRYTVVEMSWTFQEIAL